MTTKQSGVWQPPPGWDPSQPPPKESSWHRIVSRRPVWILAVIAVATLGLELLVGIANQPTPHAAAPVPGPTVTVPGPSDH